MLLGTIMHTQGFFEKHLTAFQRCALYALVCIPTRLGIAVGTLIAGHVDFYTTLLAVTCIYFVYMWVELMLAVQTVPRGWWSHSVHSAVGGCIVTTSCFGLGLGKTYILYIVVTLMIIDALVGIPRCAVRCPYRNQKKLNEMLLEDNDDTLHDPHESRSAD